MTDLQVTAIGSESDTTLVVDSRLVAEVLGIDHAQWLRNIILKYQPEIESSFGHLRFQNGTVTNSVGATNQTRYALLTEDQATCYMTYSRNTDQVRAAKRNLVRSFSKAKALLLDQAKTVVEPEPIALKPAMERISDFHAALVGLGVDANNPRIAQAVKDMAMDAILGERSVLPPSTEKWLGVAERAEQLGYPSFLVSSRRSQLGKHVKGLVPRSDRTQEDRLCNGTSRSINLYRLTDRFDTAIRSYFDSI